METSQEYNDYHKEQKWHRRFLRLAEHFAQWSHDSTKVGAVIVRGKNEVVSHGYNGFPKGVSDLPTRYMNRDEKLMYVVHAEVNAILNAKQDLNGCRIYVWPTFANAPCSGCTKAIIQAGINEIVMYSTEESKLSEYWKREARYSEIMLNERGVKITTIDDAQ